MRKPGLEKGEMVMDLKSRGYSFPGEGNLVKFCMMRRGQHSAEQATCSVLDATRKVHMAKELRQTFWGLQRVSTSDCSVGHYRDRVS